MISFQQLGQQPKLFGERDFFVIFGETCNCAADKERWHIIKRNICIVHSIIHLRYIRISQSFTAHYHVTNYFSYYLSS